MPWPQFADLDRAAWESATQRTKKVQDMSSAEMKLMNGDSVFGSCLAAHVERRAKPFIATKYNLEGILRWYQDDPHPVAVWVYLTLSRGFWLTEGAAPIPQTVVRNYEPKSALVRRQVPAEIQRHFDKGFAMTWAQIRCMYPALEREGPHNILPINAVEKNELVCRITLDASNSGDAKVPAVNDCLDKSDCHLPQVSHSMAAMSQHGAAWKKDYEDAFLSVETEPNDYKHVSFIDPRTGEECAMVAMGLGLHSSSAVMQAIMVTNLRALRRHLRRKGLRTGGADPVFGERFEYVTPRQGHELTTALGYSDDALGECTSVVSGWFSFLASLQMDKDIGMKGNFKPGKTEPPLSDQIFIGFETHRRQLEIALGQPRLDNMEAQLAVFDDPAAVVTKEDGESARGVLNFVHPVIPVGKQYYAELTRQIVALGHNAPKWTPMLITSALRRGMRMWRVLLKLISAATAKAGVRRPRFPFPGFSDASMDVSTDGWSWHCMGVMQSGKWPAKWVEYIGHHSEYALIWISELEAFAILFMIRVMASRLRNSQFFTYCDNLGVVHILNKLSTRSDRIAPILEEITWWMVAYDFELKCEHVASQFNGLADRMTRQSAPDFADRVRAFHQSYDDDWWAAARDKCPAQLPARPELRPLIPHVDLDTYMDAPEEPLDELLEQLEALVASPMASASASSSSSSSSS